MRLTLIICRLLIAGCCSALAVSEQGRISVSGPEVIETNRGVEEFDSRDRALVWRTMGGKHRRLIGGADRFVDDTVGSFREAAMAMLGHVPAMRQQTLRAEQQRLEQRLERLGTSADARDVWRELGVAEPASIPDLDYEEFVALVATLKEPHHDAR